MTYICPYIGDSDPGQLVFFILFALFWIIAGLVKKGSRAARRPPSMGTGPRPRPRPEAGTPLGIPSLSEFLKRIRGGSEEGEEPATPLETEFEQGTPRTFVPPPPPPRQPTLPRKVVPRPMSVREPRLRRAEPREGPSKEGRFAEFEVSLEKTPEFGTLVSELVAPTPAEVPSPDAYPTPVRGRDRLADVLGAAVSAPELRKGIILAEILGRPKALRRRTALASRRAAPPREKPQPPQ